jgi:AraC family transcriptional regulator of adaptative response/methylated-DNA-[protein]-cysteine methyltransferase
MYVPAGAERDDARWQAVFSRDARADGWFVFAVQSTGIYCRPSCPARRPQRSRVVFFRRPADAERAGFRPCRRCRPRDERVADQELALVEQACRYIEEHLDAPLRLRALAARLGQSPHVLRRAFARLLGITPRQYVDACRLDRVKANLRSRESVAEALYGAGYGSSSRLYERAPGQLGMTPATYRRGGRGKQIRYKIVASPLGWLLVGATGQGLCAVSLGGSVLHLTAALRAEYPEAALRRDGKSLGKWVASLMEFLRGQRPHLALPLDIQATAFQRKVWNVLRAIPYGATRSYGEIARAAGRPTAARAVARACAANPVALVIPCHRVVRQDGGLGGYRWGVKRKRALLQTEQAGKGIGAQKGEPATLANRRAVPPQAAGD